MKQIQEITSAKSQGHKLSMVTCYDYSFAKIVAASNIDIVLVGDSAAMVIHGYKNTIPANIDLMESHVAAVSRGINNKFLVADMPFLEHRKSKKKTMTSIDRLMKAGANAVKIEGGKNHTDIIKYIVDSGVPVMGHLGLTPQSVHSLGGWKIQGRTEENAKQLFDDAENLEKAGVFAIVLEMIPADLSKKITENLKIPTIGIGAGPDTSGQVLVLQDILGMNKDFNPTFVRKYLEGFSLMQNSLDKFNEEVKTGNFPSSKESF